MIFAIIESKSAGMLSPALTPVSTRMPGPAGRSSTMIRPGDGAKSRSGSSAFSRASTAWPLSIGRTPSSRPPDATCNWAFTRSNPVVSSVIGCSTCSRVFTSRNANDFSPGWYRNSTVAAPRYPTAIASRSADAFRSSTWDADSSGDADSSMTFWLRRCTEQSRTPSAHAVPSPSAITWTSTCRAPVTRRSRNTTPLPNARAASSLVRAYASESSSAERTTRMPRPPPPAVALSINGYPIRSAAASAASSDSTAPRLHGATGTPTSSAISFEPILSPSLRIASALGPMNVTPIRSHSSANAGSSATNPQPTQAASAPVSRSARSRTCRSRYGRADAGPSGYVMSASRTNVAVRSPSVNKATVSIGSPPSALTSRTALISRIAASPRFTIAIRLNIDRLRVSPCLVQLGSPVAGTGFQPRAVTVESAPSSGVFPP